MGKQIKKAKDAKAVAAVGAVRTAVTTATSELEGYAPKVSGSSSGVGNVLYSLVNGGIVYSSAGGTPSIASITADGIDTKSRDLFSNYGSVVGSPTSTAWSSVKAGTPSTIQVAYEVASGSGSATIEFVPNQNNSSGTPWSSL